MMTSDELMIVCRHRCLLVYVPACAVFLTVQRCMPGARANCCVAKGPSLQGGTAIANAMTRNYHASYAWLL